MDKAKSIFAVIFLSISVYAHGQSVVYVNQMGFAPEDKKRIVVDRSMDADSMSYELIRVLDDQVVEQGLVSEPLFWPFSDQMVGVVDLDEVSAIGNYRLVIDGVERVDIHIKNNVLIDLVKGSIKAYYFNRASTSLTMEHAGDWNRPLGHPDTAVLIHASAASDLRPEGTAISSPQGWYDAGDYNKYIVNSGISTFTLLAAYDRYRSVYDTINLNIPESSNAIPDFLDEVLWNLKWMLTMQDPEDGGVYHKLTAKNFEGNLMPHQALNQRYLVMKSTPATLDFAAVMAFAYRVLKEVDLILAEQCLIQAEKAWIWANNNPEIAYLQPEDIRTGIYGDSNFGDEFFWSAVELWLSTGSNKYLEQIDLSRAFDIPSWPSVATLGLISLSDNFSAIYQSMDTLQVVNRVLELADPLLGEYRQSAYRMPMGANGGGFVWGSNSVAANQGIILLQAFELTSNRLFLDAAYANLNYLLGMNPTGYSFVTGFGTQTPQDPHHRQSVADEVAEPVPGWLIGGPQAGQQDNCSYPSDQPALSYSDTYCSYSTNEVAINWNAALAYLSGGLFYHTSSDLGSYEKSIELMSQTSDQLVPLGHNVTLSVWAESQVALQYQWSRDGEVLDHIDGPNLAIPSVKAEDEGTYQIDISDDQGASEKVFIKVSLAERVPFGDESGLVPGIIEAEDFDLGGNGFTFFDHTEGNQGGAYREESVDIVEIGQGGFAVSNILGGEWLTYSVNVEESDRYTLDFSIASASPLGSVTAFFDDQNLGTVEVPSTGGSRVFQSVTLENINLQEGRGILRLDFETGIYSLDKVTFVQGVALDNRVNRNSEIQIWPNPVGQTFHINGLQSNKCTQVNLYSTDGKLAYSTKLSAGTSLVQGLKLRTGLYIATINQIGSQTRKKLILMK